MPTTTRYAIVGTGSRCDMYVSAMYRDFADRAALVGLCDVNQGRMDYRNATIAERFGGAPVATFLPHDYERMLRETRTDTVIVTSIDRTHADYIVRALDCGCDVISEKPLTTDERACNRIFDAVERSGKRVRVTFNYRYSPRATRVKQLLMDGVIGDVKSVHFEWLLDTRHGADYFRRWHRDIRNSGGLMVHKATHHFDLVNWWTDSVPDSVFGFGDLVFYGRANAEQRGVTSFYARGTGEPAAAGDPFALDLEQDAALKALYMDQERYDAYRRDQSVFADGISIEDDMGVLVKYTNGMTMSYHLTAYSPWEGFRIAFNGTKGRLECEIVESEYLSADGGRVVAGPPPAEPIRIVVRPHWQQPYAVAVDESGGGDHGGGDRRLLRDIFAPDTVEPDPLGRAADHRAGAHSILVGIAANKSFAGGVPVRVRDLFPRL